METSKEQNVDLVLVLTPSWGIAQPPIGISYLKSFLQNHGRKVRCFDFNSDLYDLHKESPQQKYWNLNYPEHFIHQDLFTKDILPLLAPHISSWAEKIIDLNPKAIGFSLYMSTINTSILLAKRLKEINPMIPILGGGPEITRIKRIFIEGSKQIAHINQELITEGIFDILNEGEGETFLLEALSLLDKGDNLYSLKNALYVKDNKIFANESNLPLPNLDILPPPDFHDFDFTNNTYKSLPIITSRGCTNRCTFCADSPIWKKYRQCSAQHVVNEIKFLINEYNNNIFEVVDSIFNADIKRLEEICDLIIAANLNIKWSAKVSLRKEMTESLLLKMRTSGCESLGYGLESGSPDVLHDMQKPVDITIAPTIIQTTKKAGIQANCFFVIGYPTETEKDFQMTLDFIQKNAQSINSFDQVTGCHIEEGSHLENNLEKYGIIFKKDGWYTKESTPQIRKDRLMRFQKLAQQLHTHYHCNVQQ